METADTFTFCQENLQSTSFSAFEEMRRKGQFCDLTIKVQNQSIAAHRIIVAAGIPYFMSAFDCVDSNSGEKEIEVQDNLDPKALESLILFAYTGKVDITTENVQSLLLTAQFLKMDQISDSCINFFSKSLNVHNAVQLRELASNLNISNIIDNCERYIRQNFEDFSRTQDFLSLPNSRVKGILLEDDLVISSEEVVFEALMKWVQFSPSERQVVLPELLAEVRLICLPTTYLMKQVDTQELIVKSKACRDLVNEVKYYNLLPEMVTEFAQLKMRPRNCFMSNLYAVCSSGDGDSQRLVIFTLANQKWLPLSSVELESSLHNAVAVNGKIYMLLENTIQIFDPENQEWELLEETHRSIKGAATVFHKGKIYCFGSEIGLFRNKIRVFDMQSEEWSGEREMKTNRWDSAAASLGEFIYVTGGYNGETRINNVAKYCPSENQWKNVAPMLIPRDEHGCTSMNGKIYVCGGVEKTDYTTGLAEVYDPVKNQWEFISSMRNSRIMISLVPHCGRIYACGKTDMEMYIPDDDEWMICKPVPMEVKGVVSLDSRNMQAE